MAVIATDRDEGVEQMKRSGAGELQTCPMRKCHVVLLAQYRAVERAAWSSHNLSRVSVFKRYFLQHTTEKVHGT
jgi:hypothetical protein